MADTRSTAASELEIRRHLDRFIPSAGSDPHVWIAPISAREDEDEKWLDIGPLEAVRRAYPNIGKIIKNWTPSHLRTTGAVLNLTPEIRCMVALIGESKKHG